MNKSILNIHLDILDKKRREVLNKLLPFAKNFVLGGGTALSLQLAHRASFDFDFFSQSPIDKHLLEILSNAVTIKNVVTDTADELTFFTTDSIKITFLYYPFQSKFEHIQLDNDLSLFSVEQIAIQKAYAIGRRGEYRDYFDLYTIFKNDYISLPELMSQAKNTYGSIFDEKIFLEQLVYFEDMLSFEIIPVFDEKLPAPKELRQYFQELVKAYLRQ